MEEIEHAMRSATVGELVHAKRSGSCQHLDVEASQGMFRMVTDTSVMSITSHELTEARWFSLETMIQEERACRVKEIAKLHQALAELQDTASTVLCNSKTNNGTQDQGSDFVGDKSQACSGSVCDEVCVAPRRAKDVRDDAMLAVNELIAELRQNFASQLQDVEAKFHAQTEKQMTLLESSLESMKRLQNQMREIDPAQVPGNGTETIAPKTAKAGNETPVLLSQGSLLHRGQAPMDLKKQEQSTGPGAIKTSMSLKELIFTPRPAGVGIANSAGMPCQMKATPPSSPLAVPARASPIIQSRQVKRSITAARVRTPAIGGSVVMMQCPVSPALTSRSVALPVAHGGYPLR